MTKKANWEKEFDKKFPYGGMIIEDDGSRYTFDDIKAFIRSLLQSFAKEVREKVIKSIPIDNNATCGGVINFASQGIGKDDTAKAFQYGFGRGYKCHTHETGEAVARELDQLEKEWLEEAK